jgi:DNA-binding LacI/PurR family transcriptional regulator
VSLVKQPTILDVAERAGVSKSLVSLAMRGSDQVSAASRKAIFAAASELGYRPNAAARSLVRQRSFIFGVMLSDLHNPFFAEVVDGIDDAAVSAGYRALYNSGRRSPRLEAEAIETLLELRVDGLIVAAPAVGPKSAVAAAQSVPTVVVGRATRSPEIDCVTNDDRLGGELVVDHLVSLGHRRIAHIHGGSGAGAHPRRTGYERAMRRHDLAAEIRTVAGAYTEDAGMKGMAELLDSGDPPTAVFAANDVAAIGALGVLDESGLRVPEDMSVVGYDNTHISGRHRFDLTTVDQPRFEIGRTAVALLLERLDGERFDAKRVVLAPRLVARGSSAGVPRGAAARPA